MTSIEASQATLDKFGYIVLSCRPKDLPAIGLCIDMHETNAPHEGKVIVTGYTTKEDYTNQSLYLGQSLPIRLVKGHTKFFKVVAE